MISMLFNQIEENTNNEKIKELVGKGRNIVEQLTKLEEEEEAKKSHTSLKEVDKDENGESVKSQVMDEKNEKSNIKLIFIRR